MPPRRAPGPAVPPPPPPPPPGHRSAPRSAAVFHRRRPAPPPPAPAPPRGGSRCPAPAAAGTVGAPGRGGAPRLQLPAPAVSPSGCPGASRDRPVQSGSGKYRGWVGAPPGPVHLSQGRRALPGARPATPCQPGRPVPTQKPLSHPSTPFPCRCPVPTRAPQASPPTPFPLKLPPHLPSQPLPPEPWQGFPAPSASGTAFHSCPPWGGGPASLGRKGAQWFPGAGLGPNPAAKGKPKGDLWPFLFYF